MKEFKYNFSGDEDIILQYPDDLDFSLSESTGIVGYGLQKAINEGKVRVTRRVWPCLYCGNRTFGSQTTLIKHFEASHLEGEKQITDWLTDRPTNKTGAEK